MNVMTPRKHKAPDKSHSKSRLDKMPDRSNPEPPGAANRDDSPHDSDEEMSETSHPERTPELTALVQISGSESPRQPSIVNLAAELRLDLPAGQPEPHESQTTRTDDENPVSSEFSSSVDYKSCRWHTVLQDKLKEQKDLGLHHASDRVRRTLEDTLTDGKVTGKACTIKAKLDDMREQREWHQGYDQRGQFLQQLATHLKQEFKTEEIALKACDAVAGKLTDRFVRRRRARLSQKASQAGRWCRGT
jgi:hypothetical protein